MRVTVAQDGMEAPAFQTGTLTLNCRNVNSDSPGSQRDILTAAIYSIDPGTVGYEILNLTRVDGLPDIDSNPPPESEPIYSVAAGVTLAPYTPTVGEVPSPPGALISQPGDPLYDAARVPLQWVMDGTAPPWARAENPVARLPGARTVPSAPAAPTSVPQPDVAPGPSKDDKPANPYPFFDPVTFPDTTTPDIFNIPPAFVPTLITSNPLTPTP